ncbi:DUF4097 family beta strand repeat-containing protein [Streptomyces lanatus]|uniref:DUF4097 family beta strand repeat-containing protein n=1 Tax=Streptomyces lanatus TaxID=66900 RepID=A0ABV1XJS9_9ACTN|nr:DUF4097 family beta strand repeat-containing protein [Streptomyces lanatus]GHG90950.1 lipoprotein [Streptomyces lanatus]
MARTVPARAAAVAAVVVVLVAGVAACGADAGDDKEPENRSFPLQGRTLTIDSDDSALEIVAGDENKAGTVEVTRWFKGSVAVGSEPRVTWEMKDDDRLVLREKCSGMIANCATKHRIEVPRGVTVKVEDGDGSVRARGFKDALSIRTGDGSVQVTDSSGPLDLKTGDGSVRVSDVASRRVKAQTGDGSIRLELGTVPDRVETRSGDGSVTIELPRSTYDVETRTGDGSVDVSVPRDNASSHAVSAHTGDGNVTVRTAN